jgi:hypothetical protein
MMAKTGICSIVVIATHKNVLSHFTPKIKPRIQPFFKRLQAPKMKGVRTCFTDAVLVNLFLGYSRKHAYAYDDGEILGSLIGRIDIETMKIDFTKISPTNKFEGLTLF